MQQSDPSQVAHCRLHEPDGKSINVVHALDVRFYISNGTGDMVELLAVGVESDAVGVRASGGGCGLGLDEPVARFERGVCRGWESRRGVLSQQIGTVCLR